MPAKKNAAKPATIALPVALLASISPTDILSAISPERLKMHVLQLPADRIAWLMGGGAAPVDDVVPAKRRTPGAMAGRSRVFGKKAKAPRASGARLPKPKIDEATVVGVMSAKKRPLARWELREAIRGCSYELADRLLKKLVAAGRARALPGGAQFQLVGLGAPKAKKAAASGPSVTYEPDAPSPSAALKAPKPKPRPLEAQDLHAVAAIASADEAKPVSAFVAGAKLDSGIVGRCLAQLQKIGTIAKEGEGRGTKYRLVLSHAAPVFQPPSSKPNGAGKQPAHMETQPSAEA